MAISLMVISDVGGLHTRCHGRRPIRILSFKWGRTLNDNHNHRLRPGRTRYAPL